jgi:hypothetical protein
VTAAGVKPQHQESDATVHRKMLALMALEAHMQVSQKWLACLLCNAAFWALLSSLAPPPAAL